MNCFPKPLPACGVVGHSGSHNHQQHAGLDEAACPCIAPTTSVQPYSVEHMNGREYWRLGGDRRLSSSSVDDKQKQHLHQELPKNHMRRRGCSQPSPIHDAANGPSSSQTTSHELALPSSTMVATVAKPKRPTRRRQQQKQHRDVRQRGVPSGRIRTSPSRAPRRGASVPSRREREGHMGEEGLQPRSRHRQPDWDWTQSDMSRYQLTSAEQLRNHLIHISRNRDEAASLFQHKLRRMRKDLAPFLDTREDAKLHMSPCFASKVPTGRMPPPPCHTSASSKAWIERGTRLGAASASPARASIARSAQPVRNRQGEDSIQGAVADSTDGHGKIALDWVGEHCGEEHDFVDALDEALETEIASFEGTTCQSRAQKPVQPEYKILRRCVASQPAVESDSVCHQHHRNHRAPGLEGLASQLDQSDSDLDSIEDGANELQAQLAWWRRQEELLLDAASRAVEADEEFHWGVETAAEEIGLRQEVELQEPAPEAAPLPAESEWLKVSEEASSVSSGDRTTPSQGDKDAAPSSDVPQLPQSGHQSNPPLQISSSSQKSPEQRVTRGLDSFDPPLRRPEAGTDNHTGEMPEAHVEAQQTHVVPELQALPHMPSSIGEAYPSGGALSELVALQANSLLAQGPLAATDLKSGAEIPSPNHVPATPPPRSGTTSRALGSGGQGTAVLTPSPTAAPARGAKEAALAIESALAAARGWAAALAKAEAPATNPAPQSRTQEEYPPLPAPRRHAQQQSRVSPSKPKTQVQVQEQVKKAPAMKVHDFEELFNL